MVNHVRGVVSVEKKVFWVVERYVFGFYVTKLEFYQF